MEKIPAAIRRIANSEDRKLAIEFFICFSRFEYALKRRGFTCGDTRSVKPDWDSFAIKYNSQFKQGLRGKLLEAWAYFRDHPPKKQVLVNDKLDWSDTGGQWSEPEQKLKWLLRMIRRTRNNLFHGGKVPEGSMESPSRDQNLLSMSLVVLYDCLTYDNEVCSSFTEDLFEKN